jgi:hypothetical protein
MSSHVELKQVKEIGIKTFFATMERAFDVVLNSSDSLASIASVDLFATSYEYFNELCS